MNTYEIIKKKRDGLELSVDEINYMVNGFTKGEIPDYQMSAFLMSVYFQGMNSRECVDLTVCMANSGNIINLSGIKGFKVDKHSTGGVGDTTTLVLAPLVAACGGTVAKMTGRELGHTGGTVDKLESIPGMQLEMKEKKFIDIVNSIGVGLITQTTSLAPADKQIYGLRNVTATVDSIPLIASSIMSKKLAAGADGIVLDVKIGRGSFIHEYDKGLELAKTMVNIGEDAGKRVVALITGMDQPLGFAIGNSIEVEEAIDTLKGEGPEDLMDLVKELGSNMLILSGIAPSAEDAEKRIENAIKTRKGLERFGDLIEAQGGNRDVIDNPGLLPQPKIKLEVESHASGYVEKIDALEIGLTSKLLGAGRQTKDDEVDLSVGIFLRKKVGDKVERDEPLAVFYTDGDDDKLNQARERFLKAFTIVPHKVESPKLFFARVSKEGVEEFQ
ncbi:pyrimidine-nucleoside phosphorylase [Thermodesulfobacteriota bacterium]